jgi:hypothetical protein
MDALLKKYKDEYGNVFAADIKDQQFIFRELTRKEYKRIVEDTYGNNYEWEEAICSTVVLYPEEYDFYLRGRAGMTKTLAEEIVAISGFSHPDQQAEMLQYYRSDMINFDSQAETVIQLVFPNTTEEEMENWTQEKLMKRLARAEWVMKEIWQMPFEFSKRNESEEDEEQETATPTIAEIGAEIREQGGDPMLTLKDSIMRKHDHNYVPFPIIGGTKLLGNEEGLKRVREQIQGLPK